MFMYEKTTDIPTLLNHFLTLILVSKYLTIFDSQLLSEKIIFFAIESIGKILLITYNNILYSSDTNYLLMSKNWRIDKKNSLS